jgi:hypothetical protein
MTPPRGLPHGGVDGRSRIRGALASGWLARVDGRGGPLFRPRLAVAFVRDLLAAESALRGPHPLGELAEAGESIQALEDRRDTLENGWDKEGKPAPREGGGPWDL